MQNISTFLGKFKNIQPPERFVKEVFVRVVSDVCGVKLPENDIVVKKSIIYITTNSVVKNELFLQKKALLTKLNKELQQDKKVIQDIR